MQTAVLTDRGPVVVERTFMAPRARVWTALTEPAEMRIWYFPRLTDFRAEVEWRVTAVIPWQKISYEWWFPGHPGSSVLTIELFEQLGMTWLRLTHAGIENFRGDLFPDLAKEKFVEGWRSLIGKALNAYLKGQAPGTAVTCVDPRPTSGRSAAHPPRRG